MYLVLDSSLTCRGFGIVPSTHAGKWGTVHVHPFIIGGAGAPLVALTTVMVDTPQVALALARTRRSPTLARAAAKRARRPTAAATPTTAPMRDLPHLCSATQVAA